METIFISHNSQKFYNYLFHQGQYFLSNDSFYFLVINTEVDEDEKKLLEFLDAMIPNQILMKLDGDFIMFHESNLDVDIKDIISSVSDDFGINFLVFASGKIKKEEPNNFQIIYNAYKTYLERTPLQFATISDLILAMIKQDLKSLKKIKAAVLNDINDDSQMEKLILSMFDNNLNVTKTANDVYMHRNTIINKLEYIRTETGLNLQNFKDAICLYWLLKI